MIKIHEILRHNAKTLENTKKIPTQIHKHRTRSKQKQYGIQGHVELTAQ